MTRALYDMAWVESVMARTDGTSRDHHGDTEEREMIGDALLTKAVCSAEEFLGWIASLRVSVPPW